ncbi:unnamed protein product, partial [Durusdinium trenchii]
VGVPAVDDLLHLFSRRPSCPEGTRAALLLPHTSRLDSVEGVPLPSPGSQGSATHQERFAWNDKLLFWQGADPIFHAWIAIIRPEWIHLGTP